MYILYKVLRILVNEDYLLGKTSGSCSAVDLGVRPGLGGHSVYGAVDSQAGHVTYLCRPTDKVISECLGGYVISASERRVPSFHVISAI